MARNKNRKKSASKNQNSKNLSVENQSEQEQASLSGGVKIPSGKTGLKAAPEKTKYGQRGIPDGESSLKNAANAASHVAAEKSSPGKAESLVRLSTCVAGMFLTFVLGIFLGSLVPGIMQGMEEEKQIAQRSPETAPLPVPAPAPEPRVQGQPQERTQPSARKDSAAAAIPREIMEHMGHLEKDALSHPDDSRIWTELGNAYFDIHEHEKAIAAYEHSLSLSPSNPDVLTDLGIMYRETRNYEKALECFRKAHQQDPKHINALFNEGVVLSSDLGRKAEAARVWRLILDIDPAAATPNGQKIADMVRQLQ